MAQGGLRITSMDWSNIAFVIAAVALIVTVVIGHLPTMDALRCKVYHIAQRSAHKWSNTGR